MSQHPLVSVVVNTYNYGRFIDEAIESVLRQTVPAEDLEVIVVDDGSTDDTNERVRKYGRQITYVYKSNGGQASALNLGLSMARGEYIALLDADDFWFPNKLETVLEEFRRWRADVVSHNAVLWDGVENNRLLFPYKREGWIANYISPTSGITLHRDVIRLIYPIPTCFRVSADLFVISILNVVGRRILFLCQPLGAYRLHGENLYTGQLDRERVKRRMDAYAALLASLEDEAMLRERGLDPSALRRQLQRVREYARAAIEESRLAAEASLIRRLGVVAQGLRQGRLSGVGVYGVKLVLLAVLGQGNYRRLMELRKWIQYRIIGIRANEANYS